MLNDATCFCEVYIICSYTDLRSGMDRLAAVIEAKTGTSPYVPGALYLFLPLYRQKQEFVWYGLNISRQNMANWTIQCADRYLAIL